VDDRQIDELLTSALGRASGSPEAADLAREECLDASTLAAWASGALDSHASDEVERHLATCARCQEMAAIFARTEPVPAAVVPLQRPSPLRWIGPLVGLAAAATLVWAVWLRPSPATAPSPVTTAARADVPAGPGTTAGNAAASPEPAAAAAAIAPTSTPADAQAKLQRQQAARNETGRVTQAKPQFGQRSTVSGAEPPKSASIPVLTTPPPPAPVAAPMPAATPPPPPPPPPAAQPTFRAGVPVEPPATVRQMQEQVTVVDAIAQTKVAVVAEFSSASADVEAAPANRAAGGGGGGRGGRGGGFAGGAGAGIAASVATRPTVPVRWRILASGAVERSTDGVTWSAVTIDPPAQLTAGAAPSSAVCWLVGKGGVVLRSADGQRFARVTSPVEADLVAIRAVAGQVTVTTADGRAFTTLDNGVTWREGR